MTLHAFNLATDNWTCRTIPLLVALLFARYHITLNTDFETGLLSQFPANLKLRRLSLLLTSYPEGMSATSPLQAEAMSTSDVEAQYQRAGNGDLSAGDVRMPDDAEPGGAQHSMGDDGNNDHPSPSDVPQSSGSAAPGAAGSKPMGYRERQNMAKVLVCSSLPPRALVSRCRVARRLL